MTLQPSRQFSFISVRNNIPSLLLGCRVVGNAQRYPRALWSLRSSIHQARHIHQPKEKVSYDTLRSGSYPSRAVPAPDNA
jgi:hypothetical protein